MTTHNSKMLRLEYIYSRKNFLNQKTYHLFERFQIAVAAYVGYVYLFLTDGGAIKNAPQITLDRLNFAASTILVFVLVVFLILLFFVGLEWGKYEVEENEIHGTQEDETSKIKYLTWVEFHFAWIAVLETIFVISASVLFLIDT